MIPTEAEDVVSATNQDMTPTTVEVTLEPNSAMIIPKDTMPAAEAVLTVDRIAPPRAEEAVPIREAQLIQGYIAPIPVIGTKENMNIVVAEALVEEETTKYQQKVDAATIVTEVKAQPSDTGKATKVMLKEMYMIMNIELMKVEVT